MHHVHNSTAKAMAALGEEVEEILDDIFFYLRYAKAATSFDEAQRLLDLEPLKFLRRVESCWLQIYDVTERFLQLFPALTSYFASLPATEQKKERVQRILSYLNSADSSVYLNFVLFAIKTLKDFETFFQTSKPVILLLYDRMISLVAEVCHSFLRPEFIDEVVNTKEFQEIRTEQELSDNDLLIGKETLLIS